MEDQEAATVARVFYNSWISRYGTPLRITTDQGRQFDSYLFKQLNGLLGTTHLRTTAYHPSANGMVERHHRPLKAAIMCHQNDRWTDVLPTVLLGIRAAWKDDLRATSADLVYGQPLPLPSEFLNCSIHSNYYEDTAEFLKALRQHIRNLRPVASSCHGSRKIFVFKDLATSDHVLVRHDGPKRLLQQPYDGPLKVIKRSDKTFLLNVNGKDVNVSIDRLKSAYMMIEDPDDIMMQQKETTIQDQLPSTQLPPTQLPPTRLEKIPVPQSTRSGRRVRFLERLQGGFS